jgi:hypothetical protein
MPVAITEKFLKKNNMNEIDAQMREENQWHTEEFQRGEDRHLFQMQMRIA